MNLQLRSTVRQILFLLGVASLASCSQPQAPKPEGSPGKSFVSGVVTYRQRIALPPEAIVRVELLDLQALAGPVQVG
ncbi:MAG: YbaY family lipoprotein, partial [Tepidisphaeraceae bacterium]